MPNFEALREITGSVVSSASDGPCSVGPGAREVSHRKEQVELQPLSTAVFCKHVAGMTAKPTLQRRKTY